jgi:hypothetical protein
MSCTFFAEQASMTRARFWEAVDTLLCAVGQQNACWNEELADLYRDGVPVPQAFRMVMARRARR